MDLPVQVATCFGVLEYWSIGVLAKQKPTFNLNWSFHYSITPLGCRKLERVMGAPAEGSAKPGPLGPDSLFFYFLLD
jgi:hypothetical protein